MMSVFCLKAFLGRPLNRYVVLDGQIQKGQPTTYPMAILHDLMPLRQLCLKTIQCKKYALAILSVDNQLIFFRNLDILDMYLLTKDRVLERIHP